MVINSGSFIEEVIRDMYAQDTSRDIESHSLRTNAIFARLSESYLGEASAAASFLYRIADVDDSMRAACHSDEAH